MGQVLVLAARWLFRCVDMPYSFGTKHKQTSCFASGNAQTYDNVPPFICGSRKGFHKQRGRNYWRRSQVPFFGSSFSCSEDILKDSWETRDSSQREEASTITVACDHGYTLLLRQKFVAAAAITGGIFLLEDEIHLKRLLSKTLVVTERILFCV